MFKPGRYTQNQLPSELFNNIGNVTYNGQTYTVSNNGDGTRTIGGGGGSGMDIPAFSFNYDQAETEARAKLEPYYKQKLTEAQGDVEKAKKLIEDDYAAGVRSRADTLQNQLGTEKIENQQESNKMNEDLNKRGVLLGEKAPADQMSVAPYSQFAQQQITPMQEKQALRKQAIERAIQRQDEVAGFDRRKALEDPSMDTSRVQRDFKEEQEKRIQTEFVPMAQERAKEKYNQTYQQSMNQAIQRSLSANQYLQTAGWN